MGYLVSVCLGLGLVELLPHVLWQHVRGHKPLHAHVTKLHDKREELLGMGWDGMRWHGVRLLLLYPCSQHVRRHEPLHAHVTELQETSVRKEEHDWVRWASINEKGIVVLGDPIWGRKKIHKGSRDAASQSCSHAVLQSCSPAVWLVLLHGGSRP